MRATPPGVRGVCPLLRGAGDRPAQANLGLATVVTAKLGKDSTGGTTMGTISLPQAALKLGWTWQYAYKQMLRGALPGGERRGARWFVSARGVQELLASRETQPAA